VVNSCWLDEEGRLYLATDIGFGIVHSQDMLDAAQAVEQGLWQPEALLAAEAPARFAYVRDPAAS
jgi:imidazolonepropionase-like amidohydrolase